MNQSFLNIDPNSIPKKYPIKTNLIAQKRNFFRKRTKNFENLYGENFEGFT